MEKDKEISGRLRVFGEAHYTSMAAFARSIGISSQQLNDYMSGKAGVGVKMLKRLRAVGCDIEWLLTGRSREGDGKIRELISILKQHGIVEPDVLRKILESDKSRSEISPVLYDLAVSVARAVADRGAKGERKK